MKKHLLACAGFLSIGAAGAAAGDFKTAAFQREIDEPHGTRVLQGFPRSQPSERPRDRVETPRNGCFRAGNEKRRGKSAAPFCGLVAV
jgi:hypothetical protein